MFPISLIFRLCTAAGLSTLGLGLALLGWSGAAQAQQNSLSGLWDALGKVGKAVQPAQPPGSTGDAKPADLTPAREAEAGVSPALADAAPMRMTAKEAVAGYKDNGFGFQRQYSGKTLRVVGPIQSITGTGERATISLQGHMPADPQTQGFQDLVRCVVSDPAALGKAARLKRGATVQVSGLYQPETQGFEIGVELQNCQPE